MGLSGPYAHWSRNAGEKSRIQTAPIEWARFKARAKKRLDHLIAQYRRNPECFTGNQVGIKPGTKLIRNWKGERHTVTVLDDGCFSHKDKKYTSLSEVASMIAGSRWNGWAFFGLKYKKEKKV